MKKKHSEAAELAAKLHPFYRGKVQIAPKVPVNSVKDFSVWYTPGVAEPCRIIENDPNMSFEHTNRANTIAVISDGTRVLGLGDIGPLAAMPVMEGKALLFKVLGGVDAVPLCIDEKDPDRFIDIVKALEPSFGGINLEDIAQPKCFYILDRLRREMEIPVWHDDQQGTAAVTVAGMINAARLVGKPLNEMKIVMLGAGAASTATLRILFMAGVDPEKVIVVDYDGIVSGTADELKERYPFTHQLLASTNGEKVRGGLETALRNADAVIAYTAQPGLLKPEHIRLMASDPIVFAGSNPVPEIWPEDAKAAGARVVATGRSDFPNQINNSLGFPGIFRGALDVRARTITDEMCLEAAKALADYAYNKGLDENHIVPSMDDREVFIEEAVRVALKAIEQGVARLTATEEELRLMATERITYAWKLIETMMESGLIPPMEEAGR